LLSLAVEVAVQLLVAVVRLEDTEQALLFL
jgi:hypothetical protein